MYVIKLPSLIRVGKEGHAMPLAIWHGPFGEIVVATGRLIRVESAGELEEALGYTFIGFGLGGILSAWKGRLEREGGRMQGRKQGPDTETP